MRGGDVERQISRKGAEKRHQVDERGKRRWMAIEMEDKRSGVQGAFFGPRSAVCAHIARVPRKSRYHVTKSGD